MGTERTPAGEAGSDMMGEPDRGTRGIHEPGTAEVRTGLHSGRPGEEYGSLGFADESVGERARSAARGAVDTVRENAGQWAGTVREGASQLGQRAGETAQQARRRLGDLSERTNQMLDERGMLDRLKENPLPALAIAFGVGFLLAGGRRSGYDDSAAGRARRELRNALMAGLTAGAAQATRGFLQAAGGSDGILNAVRGEGGTRPAGEEARQGARGRMSGGLGETGLDRDGTNSTTGTGGAGRSTSTGSAGGRTTSRPSTSGQGF